MLAASLKRCPDTNFYAAAASFSFEFKLGVNGEKLTAKSPLAAPLFVPAGLLRNHRRWCCLLALLLRLIRSCPVRILPLLSCRLILLFRLPATAFPGR